MALIAGDSSGTAAERAMQKLKGGAGPAPTGASASAFQIPVKVGSYSYGRDTNRGQFDGDIHTTGPKVRQNVTNDQTSRFSLTDEGVNAAMGTWYSFDDKDRAALAKKMWFLGLVKDPNDFDGAYTVWKSAVEHAARFALTGREIDPRDVLNMMGDASGGVGSGSHEGATTRRAIDLTDPVTAEAWVQQAFHQSMGRKAEDAEVRALVEALHQKQQSSPSVTTNTPTKWDDKGQAIDSTTTTTGGVDPNAFFAHQVANDPEAGAHQAAAQLFPALMQAITGGG